MTQTMLKTASTPKRVTAEQALALRQLLEASAELTPIELCAVIAHVRRFAPQQAVRWAISRAGRQSRTRRAAESQVSEAVVLFIAGGLASAAVLARLLGMERFARRLRTAIDAARSVAVVYAAECEHG